MHCQICQKNRATVHVTEVATEPVPAKAQPGCVRSRAAEERHVCALCAHSLFGLVVAVAQPKVKVNIMKLLQAAKEKSSLVCPDCGMSLAEFRSKGRLGCPKDYELFWPHLVPLLERVHNATAHVNQPGTPSDAEQDPDGEAAADPAEDERRAHLTDLRAKLETAIREEAYESAAKLRDAIEELEKSSAAGD